MQSQRMGRFSNSVRLNQALALLLLVLLLACSRPIDRPRQGALPGEAGDRQLNPPPTLSSPLAQETPGGVASPVVLVSMSPSPSPALAGRNPIISALSPPADAALPPGPVSVGARVSGSSELTEATITLNGAPVAVQIERQDPQTWRVTHSGTLAPGSYSAQISARDRDGRVGGFRWQFTVGQPAATPPVGATVTPLPKPAPAPPVMVPPLPPLQTPTRR